MQYAVGFSMALLFLVVYIPVPKVHEIFNTTPLTVEEWLAVAPLMLLPAAVAEIQKLVLFRSKRFS